MVRGGRHPSTNGALVKGLSLGIAGTLAIIGGIEVLTGGGSTRDPERFPGSNNAPALIEVTGNGKGAISGMVLRMQVEQCVVSDEGLDRVQRGIPPAIGDLACVGNAQVAQP